jgi:hypothetical protein
MVKHLYQKGHPKLGGRKKGTKNWRTVNEPPKEKKSYSRARREVLAAKEAFQAALAGDMKFTPLQVMHAVMLLRISQGDDQGALEAAKEAAPYVHARLNASEVMVHHSLHNRSDAEIASDIEALRLKIAASKTIEATAEPVYTVTETKHADLRQPAGQPSYTETLDVPASASAETL